MHPLPVPGSMIGGRYRVDEALGHGGMGAIFAATNVATGRAVAIKLLLPQAALSPESIERFLVEARATSRIEHPNVISVFDVGEESGMPFLVMERLRGESLGARLMRGPLSIFDALDILIPACRGVAEAHAEGVVHRDLKPDNIFLCQGKDGSNRAPKVLDFGVSKLYEDPYGRPLTQTGISMGTPEYMCPEQINGPREVDPLFDVYSMGIVLYQTITGQLPYRADNLYQLVQQIACGQPTPMRALVADVPPDLDAAVLRAMHAHRAYRQPSMRDLAAELEPIRERFARPITAPPEGWAPTPAPSYPGLPPHPPHTGPAAYAPQAYLPAPQPQYAPPPQKKGSGLLIAALVGGVAVVLLLAVGIGVVWALGRRGGGDGAGGGVTSGDPLRPHVDLRFRGECRPRFDGSTLAVTANNQGLNVSSLNGNTILGTLTIVPGVADTHGTIPLSTSQFQSTQMQVGVMMEGQRQFWNWRSAGSMMGPDPITGTITFATFQPDRGVMDVSFDDVTLQETLSGALCRVDGRVRTSGLSWGDR